MQKSYDRFDLSGDGKFRYYIVCFIVLNDSGKLHRPGHDPWGIRD